MCIRDRYEENHQKLEDAKADIIQAKADLADVDVPEWYVLDRNYITTCVASVSYTHLSQ